MLLVEFCSAMLVKTLMNDFFLFLCSGLPDWKMPIYYYRRMRKMGLAEGLAYTLIIATICQYFINWAAYWEKRFTLKENLSSQVFDMHEIHSPYLRNRGRFPYSNFLVRISETLDPYMKVRVNES